MNTNDINQSLFFLRQGRDVRIVAGNVMEAAVLRALKAQLPDNWRCRTVHPHAYYAFLLIDTGTQLLVARPGSVRMKPPPEFAWEENEAVVITEDAENVGGEFLDDWFDIADECEEAYEARLESDESASDQ